MKLGRALELPSIVAPYEKKLGRFFERCFSLAMIADRAARAEGAPPMSPTCLAVCAVTYFEGIAREVFADDVASGLVKVEVDDWCTYLAIDDVLFRLKTLDESGWPNLSESERSENLLDQAPGYQQAVRQMRLFPEDEEVEAKKPLPVSKGKYDLYAFIGPVSGTFANLRGRFGVSCIKKDEMLMHWNVSIASMVEDLATEDAGTTSTVAAKKSAKKSNEA